MEDISQSDIQDNKKNLLSGILLTIVGFAIATYSNSQPTVMSVLLGFFIYIFIVADLLIIISTTNTSFFESVELVRRLDFVVAVSFSLILFLYMLSSGILTKDIPFLGDSIVRDTYLVIINFAFFIGVSLVTFIVFFALHNGSVRYSQLRKDIKPAIPFFIFLLVLSNLNPVNLFKMFYNIQLLFGLSFVVAIVLAFTEVLCNNPEEKLPFPFWILLSICIIITIVLWLLNTDKISTHHYTMTNISIVLDNVSLAYNNTTVNI